MLSPITSYYCPASPDNDDDDDSPSKKDVARLKRWMKSWMGAARSTTSVPDDSIDWGQMVADARTQSPAQETLLTNKIWHFYVRQIIFPGP